VHHFLSDTQQIVTSSAPGEDAMRTGLLLALMILSAVTARADAPRF